jgi:hypothetical protein
MLQLAALTLCLQVHAAKKPTKADPPLPTTMAKVVETPVPVDTHDDSRKVAEAYLNALTGQGSDSGRDLLLGGATMTAQIFTLENWKVVGRENHRNEVGDVADLNALVEAVDKAGRAALAKIMEGGPAGSGDDEGLETQQVSLEDAKKIQAPTRAKVAVFNKTHPVFAYVARVDREVYWHPKNPFRKLLSDAGPKGPYTIDVDKFWIETDEGIGESKTPRKWPLRVVRFRSNGQDTGYKILPASDWNAE